MNHNIHNVYIELYDTGEYPEWIVQQSEPKKTYESQAYSLIVDALKADHVLSYLFSLVSVLSILPKTLTDPGMMH